jgi:hypothetical protein
MCRDSIPINIHSLLIHLRLRLLRLYTGYNHWIIVGRVAHSVLRLTTGWTALGSNPGGARFSARTDRPWGPPSLLYNGYWVFPGGEVRPGSAADHSPPSSAAVMEE